MYFKKIAHPCLFIFVLNVLGGEKNTSSLFLTVPLGFCLGATVMKLSLGLKGEVNSCMYCPFIFNLFLNLHTCVLWDGVGQWLVLRCELWSGVQGVWVHAVPCTRTAGKQELNIQSCFMSCLGIGCCDPRPWLTKDDALPENICSLPRDCVRYCFLLQMSVIWLWYKVASFSFCVGW